MRNTFVSVVLVPNQNEGNRKVRVSTPPSPPPRHLINQCTQNLWRGMFLKRQKENNQSFSIKSRNCTKCFIKFKNCIEKKLPNNKCEYWDKNYFACDNLSSTRWAFENHWSIWTSEVELQVINKNHRLFIDVWDTCGNW